MKPTFTRRQQLNLLTAAGFGAPFATPGVADEVDKHSDRVGVPENPVAPGDLTRDIKLAGNDLSRVREVVKFRDGGKTSAVRLLNNFE